MTRTPCSSATRFRLKSLVRMTRLRACASATSLASTSVDIGHVVLDDLDRRARLLLHPRQDLQAAPATVAPERVGAVGDVLELVEHEPRDDERPEDEPGLDDLGDPAVDDGARVDDDARFAGGARCAPSAGGRRMSPTASRRDQQVARAWRRSARASRDPGTATRPSGSHVPHGAGRPASGRPRSRPMSRPISSPTTAVTNSAVDSSSTRRISHVAGTTVMYGQDREADARPRRRPRPRAGAPA